MHTMERRFQEQSTAPFAQPDLTGAAVPFIRSLSAVSGVGTPDPTGVAPPTSLLTNKIDPGNPKAKPRCTGRTMRTRRP
jgi:hypothetical protein